MSNDQFDSIRPDPEEFLAALKRERVEREQAVARLGAEAPPVCEPLGVTCADGCYEDEGGWRWLGPRAGLILWRENLAHVTGLTFNLTCGQAGYYPRFPFETRVYLDGTLVASLRFTDGEQAREVRIDLPASATDAYLRLESDSSFTPADVTISGDKRVLAVRLGNVRWDAAAASASVMHGSDPMKTWTCNICGRGVTTPLSRLQREAPSCPECGSTVRFRAIIHILSTHLYGKSLVLKDFPRKRGVRGAGMSDWPGYADLLSRKVDYTNTFYHKAPQLDITAIDPWFEGRFDFLICSEVFEHIPPPVSRAFANARRLLKPDGLLIFTVPYGLQEETREHFPELHQYQVVKEADQTVLRNVTRDGRAQVYRNLIFHGGPGATLEMRMFSLKGLQAEFAAAGFQPPRIWGDDYLPYGIHWAEPWALPMTARPD